MDKTIMVEPLNTNDPYIRMDVEGCFYLFIMRQFNSQLLSKYDGIIKFYLEETCFNVDFINLYRDVDNNPNYQFLYWIRIVIIGYYWGFCGDYIIIIIIIYIWDIVLVRQEQDILLLMNNISSNMVNYEDRVGLFGTTNIMLNSERSKVISHFGANILSKSSLIPKYSNAGIDVIKTKPNFLDIFLKLYVPYINIFPSHVHETSKNKWFDLFNANELIDDDGLLHIYILKYNKNKCTYSMTAENDDNEIHLNLNNKKNYISLDKLLLYSGNDDIEIIIPVICRNKLLLEYELSDNTKYWLNKYGILALPDNWISNITTIDVYGFILSDLTMHPINLVGGYNISSNNSSLQFNLDTINNGRKWHTIIINGHNVCIIPLINWVLYLEKLNKGFFVLHFQKAFDGKFNINELGVLTGNGTSLGINNNENIASKTIFVKVLLRQSRLLNNHNVLVKKYCVDKLVKSNRFVPFDYSLFISNQEMRSRQGMTGYILVKPSVWILEKNPKNEWVKSKLFFSKNAAANYIMKNRDSKYRGNLVSILSEITSVCTHYLLMSEMEVINCRFDPINNLDDRKTWDRYKFRGSVDGFVCQYFYSSDYEYLNTCNDYIIDYGDETIDTIYDLSSSAAADNNIIIIDKNENVACNFTDDKLTVPEMKLGDSGKLTFHNKKRNKAATSIESNQHDKKINKLNTNSLSSDMDVDSLADTLNSSVSISDDSSKSSKILTTSTVSTRINNSNMLSASSFENTNNTISLINSETNINYPSSFMDFLLLPQTLANVKLIYENRKNLKKNITIDNRNNHKLLDLLENIVVVPEVSSSENINKSTHRHLKVDRIDIKNDTFLQVNEQIATLCDSNLISGGNSTTRVTPINKSSPNNYIHHDNYINSTPNILSIVSETIPNCVTKMHVDNTKKLSIFKNNNGFTTVNGNKNTSARVIKTDAEKNEAEQTRKINQQIKIEKKAKEDAAEARFKAGLIQARADCNARIIKKELLSRSSNTVHQPQSKELPPSDKNISNNDSMMTNNSTNPNSIVVEKDSSSTKLPSFLVALNKMNTFLDTRKRNDDIRLLGGKQQIITSTSSSSGVIGNDNNAVPIIIDTNKNNTINTPTTSLIKTVVATESSKHRGKYFFVDDTGTSIWLTKMDINTNIYSYKDKNNIEHQVKLSSNV